MDKSTVASLKAGIEDLTAFFNDPPEGLLSRYNLATSPIDIKFGPDIESFLMIDEKNIIAQSLSTHGFLSSEHAGFLTGLASKALAHFAGADCLTQEKGLYFDGNTLEIRLAPASPLAICGRYLAAKQRLEALAQDLGATLFMGSGHWHCSLNMGGKNILDDGQDSDCREIGALERAAAGGILAFQEAFPALFIKPYLAEKRRHFGETSIPRLVFYNSRSSQASVRFNTKYHTIETRLTAQAPYQPAYLILCALRHGLTTGGKSLLEDRLHPVVTLKDHFFEWGELHDAVYEAARITGERYYLNKVNVMQDVGGYMDMLAKTMRSIDACPVMPRPLTLGMMRGCIESYRAYLASPKTQMNYVPCTIAALLEELEPLEALCAGAPQGPEANGNIPAPAYSNP